MLADDRPLPGMSGAPMPQASNDSGGETGLAAQVERLREENAALVSALCGLCVGISQISEVHRAIIAQAFDYADRFASAGPGDGSGRPLRIQVINDIRTTVLQQHRELDRRY